jgi:hypothetical protein
MTPEDYSRMRRLFDMAMELPPGERRAFVESSIPSADPLRAELLAMIDVGDESRFLESTLVLPGLKATEGSIDVPLQIGNYKILRELGRGGMGVVYLALRNDDVFHKVVALKVIGSGATAQAGFIHRFKQERQILAGLDHPNIARLLDGGSTEDGRPFYVMEYVAGSPIDEYCSRVGADIPSRVRMTVQVCEALEYLHAHAITHRDVKPNNILVTPDGRVKLVDFGIAKVDTVEGLVASSSVPGQPTMIMTPGYASPEQLAGDPAGKGSDIYSLAVVLYQLLTGHLPYVDADGRPNLAAQLSGRDPKPPSKDITRSAKPPTRGPDSRRTSQSDLDRVVLTALQHDPLRRYASVEAFAEDLRRCLDGRPIVARPVSSAYVFRKLVARNRVAAALALLLVLFAGAAAWMAIAVQIERAEFEGKQAAFERIVALWNDGVLRWPDPRQAVPVAAKVADVQSAKRLMASETLQTLSVRVADPERLKRLVAEVRRFLDRADEFSADQPPLRKEIALAYRQVGDFQSKTPRVQIADKAQAAASYRRAAAVAASLRASERAWADVQLSEINGRLRELGSRLDASLMAEAAPPRPEAVAAMTLPKVLPVAPSSQREVLPEVDPQAKAQLTQRLERLVGDAQSARQRLDVIRADLIADGKTISGDLVTTMDKIDALVEDATKSLESNDLLTADAELRSARARLNNLVQLVGRGG